MKLILPLLIAASLAGTALAQTSNGPTITDAWSRATASATGNGVVYLTVTDSGSPDTLTAASTPVASKAQLHQSKMEGGIMKMTPVDSLPVDKDHPIKLAPGGYHLMLEGMKQQLKAGDTFPLNLTFAHAGAVSTTVTVRKADTAGGAAMKGMGDMQMDGMSH